MYIAEWVTVYNEGVVEYSSWCAMTNFGRAKYRTYHMKYNLTK